MKKQLITLIAMLLPIVAHADRLIDGLYYNLDPTTKLATVTGYNTSSKSIVIPETVDYYDKYYVRTIGDNAFKGCQATSIFIPNNVQDIGKHAFENSNLNYFHFTRNLISVDDYAFKGCRNLKYVVCWYGPTVLGRDVFDGCTSLSNIYIALYTKEEFTSAQNWSSYSDKFEEYFANGKCGTNLRFLMCGVGKYTMIFTKYIDTNQTSWTGTRYNGNMNDYSNVSEIFWHKYARDITTIIVGDDVESIGNNAFADCNALTSVTIPQSLISIGDYAFSNCSALTSLSIPKNVTSIGQYAFRGCSRITSMSIPKNVTSIGQYAFSDCSHLSSVNIPDNYYFTSIAKGVFNNCISLTSIDIPGFVTSIGENAFAECKTLASVSFVENCSLSNIGDKAFINCKALTSITLPKSLKSIGYQAFYNCNNLERLKILAETPPTASDYTFNNYNINLYVPDIALTKYQNNSPWNRFTSIYPLSDYSYDIVIDGIYYLLNEADHTAQVACQYTSASNQSTYMGMVAIPETFIFKSIEYSVTSISEGAFHYCSDLTSVIIPNSVISIGASSFSGCTSLTSMIIPSSVSSIGDYAFGSCSNLTSIVCLSESSLNVSSNAFDGCTNLSKIYVYNDATNWHSNADKVVKFLAHGTCGANLAYVLIGENKYTLIIYKCGNGTGEMNNYFISDRPWKEYIEDISTIDIGDGVENIGENAFYDCNGLTSITIPNSVTSIGNKAFCWCSGLISITIPNSVTSIGDEAFRNCSALTSITIPNSVTSIGDEAFSYCSGLTSITIPNSVTSIGDEAFRNCSALTSITIPNSVTSIGNMAFYDCSSLTSITIPNSVTSIGNKAFCWCSGLISLIIPNSIKSIGQCAFANCTKLKDVYCYAEKAPSTNSDAFQDSSIKRATLHILYSSVDEYISTSPWKDFRTFKASKGDVNGDIKVNLTDVVSIVDYIIGDPSGSFIEKAADMNGDGNVNITDAVAVVNIITSGNDFEEIIAKAPEGVVAVDLALPSGTLWANMNVGASDPEDLGSYFAWGETIPQSDNTYDWSTYKYCNGSETTLTKYCTNTNYGSVDNKTVLDVSDDAATANWGPEWRMPTYAEMKELMEYTTSESATMNDVYGFKFTSKTNGNSIFLPYSGYLWEGGIFPSGSYGFYWSSTLGTTSNKSWILIISFRSTSGPELEVFPRTAGFPVRPVHK